MLKLYISSNLGISYILAYETENKDDPILNDKMTEAAENYLRFYVEGAPEILCPIHNKTLNFFAGQKLAIAKAGAAKIEFNAK